VTDRPVVPSAGAVDPLIETLPAGMELVRVYRHARGPLAFNATASSGRFRPVRPRKDEVLPTAYLAADEETALAEGVLRGVTALAAGALPRRLYRTEIEGLAMACVRVERPIHVARLHGAGLVRLGLRREDVVDCEEADYPYTAAWARALWGCHRRPAGLAWTSRQNDSSRAFILWEPRVRSGWLTLAGPEIELDREPGLDRVRRACADARVDFEG